MHELTAQICELVQKGRARNVKELVGQALEEGVGVEEILNEGLLKGMMTIGEKFKRDEVFVPDVLVSARAMNFGIAVIEPKLMEAGVKPVGKAVVGTVLGDLHDIGKNLVAMMLKAAGFEVYDIGVDQSAEAFLEKAEEVGADVIGMSALLTTTMSYMGEVIRYLEEKGVREKYIVMVGGAPVSEAFAKEIGADYYTPDAAACAEKAREAVLSKTAAS